MYFFTFQIHHTINVLHTALVDRQKKYNKYAEQFNRVHETLSVLKKIRMRMDDIGPKMDRLNKLLPPGDQLEPFNMKLQKPQC